MIVLDASFLIAYLDSSDEHHVLAVRMLLDAAGEGLGASALTLAEVLVGPARAGRLDRARNALAQLQIVATQVDDGAAVRLARIRADTNLKLPDCCVLLAAEQTGSALVTFDSRLASVARARGLRVAD